jgi:hypothetical protein
VERIRLARARLQRWAAMIVAVNLRSTNGGLDQLDNSSAFVVGLYTVVVRFCSGLVYSCGTLIRRGELEP